MENQREQRRHLITLPIAVTVVDKVLDAETHDISLGGVSIVNVSLTFGSRVGLRFSIPTQPEPIEVGGVVRWGGGALVGVQFDGLRAREVWALNKLFATPPSGVKVEKR